MTFRQAISSKVAASFEKAFRFLADSRNADGLWSDFLTLAGESVFWVSGYIGCSLVQNCEEHIKGNWLNEVGAKILEHQNVEGGWGYGYDVPSDGDSTSWCLLLLSKLGVKSEKEQGRALSFLLKHQSPIDGGFKTYADPRSVGRYMMLDENVPFDGWASSQMCVTAVAVQALIANGSTRGVTEALKFIRKGQTTQGFWNPYWWSGQLYATVNCMKALNTEGNKDDLDVLRLAQKWITDTQLPNGSWSDDPTQTIGWPFSTALALSGLMLLPHPDFAANIRKGVRWLLDKQLADGSWTPNHILRIPYPWMKEPWNHISWKTDGKAINSVIRDHRRLYTTATVFSALREFAALDLIGEKQ
jgi:squalene cyclase